ncbi:MAG: hypothetical protein IPM54_04080 [Polyangiaceae bacterium]|nr:hypothetical protein [Polyangiaceae bacterium]
MVDRTRKQPLYRKKNTTARGVHHRFGGDFRHERNAKQESPERSQGSMHGKQQRGLDYTPLFMFLLSKVGSQWDSVHREAVARLDRTEPIFWLVALREEERRAVVLIGDTSYYSGLFVDESGILQMVDPDLGPQDLTPTCMCCTHTLNGVRFKKGR